MPNKKKRKKKSPILVRNPKFKGRFEKDEAYIVTSSPLRAADFFQQGATITMEAELLNTCQLNRTDDLDIATSNIMEMTIMFRSGMWKIRTADRTYHVIDW